MSKDTATKVLATFTAIVGGLASIYALLAAAGVEMSTDLQDGITGVGGLVLLVAGLWLHPSVPVGVQKPTDGG